MDKLSELALKYEADKMIGHTYTPIYEKYFRHLKNKPIHLFEIGVGGYEEVLQGGNSLRMWKEYFKNGKITSLDVYDKSAIQEQGIKIYKGDQTDGNILKFIVESEGTPDIIIDDGSHRGAHVIKSFQVLFPLLAENGIYVVEDTQTSYWPEYGAISHMNYFKQLADGLNFSERKDKFKNPDYFDLNIVSIHFYHNLIFIFKGLNNESSNTIK